MQDMNTVIRTMSNVQTSTSSDWRKLQLEGNLRYKLGEHLAAAVAYTKSLALTPPNEASRAQLLATRSAVLLAAGRFEDAVRDAERALDGKYPGPMRFRLHLRIALCLRELGDADAANLQLQAARSSVLACGFPEEEQTQLLAAVDQAFAAPSKVQQKAVLVTYAEPPPLSYGTNGDRPCLSSAVEVQSNAQFGRHLVAAQDLQTGGYRFCFIVNLNKFV
jgi:tetratricopeptide (TPR) repeat protein